MEENNTTPPSEDLVNASLKVFGTVKTDHAQPVVIDKSTLFEQQVAKLINEKRALKWSNRRIQRYLKSQLNINVDLKGK